MWFAWDNTVLLTAQASCVALPGAGVPPALERFRSGRWALVLPLSIAVVIGVIAAVPSTADVLTWVALLLVPPGCALALGWAARGARPWMALLAAPALALTWARPDTRAGQLAGLFLVAGSCVTLGRLLAGVTPATLLKAGIVAMAAVDAYLVFSDQLQQPNAVLVAASPGPGLPQLQSVAFGSAGMGYGDLFVAAVLGGVLAMERRSLLVAAAAVLVAGLLWDQLFLVYDLLPATVPPALVLLGLEAVRRAGTLRRAPQPRFGRVRNTCARNHR
jgi:prepilin signal peptidase PulO-like enzyme (type II secretory pathway)